MPLLVGFAIVGAAVVFGVVVARGLRTAPQQTARRLLIVAGTGVMSIVVFWTGLPVILRGGAAEQGKPRWAPRVKRPTGTSVRPGTAGSAAVGWRLSPDGPSYPERAKF